MISLFILLLFSFWGFFISYQAFRYRRIYWSWPSISGFKNRKTNVDSKVLSYFTGTMFLIGSIIFFVLFAIGLFQ
jgi:hypothetical protein